MDDLTKLATDIDIHVVSRERSLTEKPITNFERAGITAQLDDDSKLKGYYFSVIFCIATTAIASMLLPFLELTNVVMLYLLGVVFIAFKFGRGPGIFSSFISVASFDFFFVPPRLSFTVSDTQYLLTFSVMFVVALVISNLTSGLRYQAVVAMHRERRSRALYDLGKSLASALTSEHIIEISTHQLSGIFQSKLAILLPDSQEKIVNTSASVLPDSNLKEIDFGIAQWVYDHQQQAGFGTDTLPSNAALYIPLQAPMRTRGVLAIVPENKRMIYLPEQRQLLDTFASQIAIAIERVHYVEIAQDALVTMESERLRNAVLGAISHDLNTPLTTIVATSELLKQQTNADDPRYQYVTMLYEQSIRMRNLVVNLLDMARLQSGKVKLKKEWQLLEEVVGTALRAMKETLVAHQIIIDLPSDLPLLEFDAVLIDRVLCNLLDNVAKYVPSGGKICISAEKKQQEVWVSVADDGPGLPENSKDQIFEKFTRGEKESTKAGVGLGLSICKAIIEAHDGKIWANNKAPHGAIFTFSLPLGIPPEPPPTDEIQP